MKTITLALLVSAFSTLFAQEVTKVIPGERSDKNVAYVNAETHKGLPAVRINGKLAVVTAFGGNSIEFEAEGTSAKSAKEEVDVQVFWPGGGKTTPTKAVIRHKGQEQQQRAAVITPRLAQTMFFTGPFNAASLNTGSFFVPNSLQTVYVSPMFSGTPQLLVNGQAALLSYAGPGCGGSCGQINFLVPSNLTVGSTATVQVSTSTGTSQTIQIAVSATGPGLYTRCQLAGSWVPIIQVYPTYGEFGPCQNSYVPAASGAYMVLYGNGFAAPGYSVNVTGTLSGGFVNTQYVGPNGYPGQWQLNLYASANNPGQQKQQMLLTINGRNLSFPFWIVK